MPTRILVQAGHAPPREPGFESQTGTAGEIEFALAVRAALKVLIDRDPRLDGIYVPGDIPNGVKCHAALFLHADGSTNTSRSGYCFGYPPQYPVNKRLANMIADEFDKLPGHPPHRLDNYTANLISYYGYSRVDTPGPEVLVEHGFLTNPFERRWLLANVDELAGAEYRALLRFFNLARIPGADGEWQPGDPIWENLPGPQPKPGWWWDARKEEQRRRKLLAELSEE